MTGAASLRFYVRDAGAPLSASPLPEGVVIDVWRPREGSPVPDGLSKFANSVWRLFDRFGVFETRSCGVLTMRVDGRLIHSSLVSPRWFRFPDMGRDDLQIGAVWTDPARRGRGLAKLAVAEIQKRWAGEYRRLWYIVDDGNDASIRVIEDCSFTFFGRGEKTAPLGISLVGRYRMTHPET